jgi:NADH-quinone oxidoreductase subunit J
MSPEILSSIVFYLFGAVLVAAAGGVVLVRNPVHAVLLLVLCFFNAAGLFVLMGAEFVAFILLIVYVGAVAVLFLFVVMMIDVKAESLKRAMKPHLWLACAVSLVLAVEVVAGVAVWQIDPASIPALPDVENTKAIGKVLYTDFVYPFQASGLILLIAMAGAIVLTHRERRGKKRQDVSEQNNVHPSDVVKIQKVGIGEGAP